MVICPVAIAVGCRKCPILRVCPVKGLIGDYKPDPKAKNPPARAATKGKAARRR